jgi:hypothetical protein
MSVSGTGFTAATEPASASTETAGPSTAAPASFATTPAAKPNAEIPKKFRREVRVKPSFPMALSIPGVISSSFIQRASYEQCALRASRFPARQCLATRPMPRIDSPHFPT